jgi:hypothetical protein
VKQGFRLVVQTGGRVLKNHGHVFAGEAAAFTVTQAQQVVAIKAQFLGLHATGEGHQAHQRHHGDAFARARFTHHTQYFASLECEADILYCVHHAVVRRKLHGQVFNF